LKYYLDRGWDLSIAKDKLRNRQATEDVNLKVSSGKMTLDEAIEHAKEIANSQCNECGKQHKQLADWLEELKQYREQSKRGL
jgi:DNA-directed RNA polymerase alpha subunit